MRSDLVRRNQQHLQFIRMHLQQALSLRVHGVYVADIGLILFLGIYFMWSTIVTQDSTFTGDNLVYYVFMNRLLNESILRLHQLPLWNPYYFSGLPYVGNPQSSPFYFSSILVLLLGEGDGTRWSVILHVILSGITMYYLLTVFKQRRLGSLLSAVGYMFSGYLWARIAIGHIAFVYAYAWSPLAFAFCVKAARTGRLQYAALAGTVLMLQLQSGGIIILGYTLILILSYLVASSLLWLLRNRRLPDSTNTEFKHLSVTISRFGSLAVVMILVFLLLSAIKLIPMIEFLSRTQRFVEQNNLAGGIPNIQGLYSSLFEKNAVYYNSHPASYGWWEYSAYVGWLIIPALAAIFLSRPKRSREIFFFVVFGVSVIFGMGASSPLSSLVSATYKYIPLFGALLHLPARFLFLAVFSVSVLSGTAISALMPKIAAIKRKNIEQFAYCLVCCFLILVIFDMGFLASWNGGTVTLSSSNGPYTSSTPNDLSIIWLHYPTSIVIPPNRSFTFSIVAKNAGDTVWLKDGPSKGTVDLVVYVGSAEFRYPLTNDVHPNDLANLTIAVPGFPNGRYSLDINFVDEKVGWEFKPPHPALVLAVSSTNQQRVLYGTIPLESYSETHALLWISKQNHDEYFRIGPYIWFEYDLYQLEKLGLYSVGGYETEGIQLPHYEMFLSDRSDTSLGLLSMKYVILNRQTSDLNLEMVYKASPWYVYQNTRYLPRAYSVQHAILTLGSDDEVLNFQGKLLNSNYFDPTKTAIIRGDSAHANAYDESFLKRFDMMILFPSITEASTIIQKCQQASITCFQYPQNDQSIRNAITKINGPVYTTQKITMLSPNSITIQGNVTSPSFLILSEVNYPGWKVNIDDKQSSILSAYSLLRAIYLDTSGTHTVKFVYEPLSFTIGAGVTVLTIAALFVIAFYRPRLSLKYKLGLRILRHASNAPN